MASKTLHFRIAKDLIPFYQECNIDKLINLAFQKSFISVKPFYAKEQESLLATQEEFKSYQNQFNTYSELSVINLDVHSNSAQGNLHISRLYDPLGNFRGFIPRKDQKPVKEQMETLFKKYTGYTGLLAFYDEDVCSGFLMHLLRTEFSKVIKGKVLPYSLHERYADSNNKEILDLKDFIYGSQVISSGLCIQGQSLTEEKPILQVPYYHNKHLLNKFGSIPLDQFEYVRSMFFQISILYAEYMNLPVANVTNYFNQLLESDYDDYLT